MFEQAWKRAALLAGIGAVLLSAIAPSDAYPVRWGAGTWGPQLRPPADIFAPERPRKSDKTKAKAKKNKVAKTKRLEGRAAKVRSVEPPAKNRTVTPRVEAKPAEPKVTVTVTRTVLTQPEVRPADVTKPRALESPGTSHSKPAAPTESKKDEKRNGKKDKAKATKPEPVPPGPLHVIVSVDAQRASLYANGTFVASTKVSTGTKTHPTPMGIFSVIQKNRHHVSNLYGAPMPYMQRLTWSGTAMHTGPLPGYPASHGCIRLENDFAQLLWRATKIGARVIVTREDVKPVELSHPRLVMPMASVAQSQPVPGQPTETTGALVRTADATVAATDRTRPADTFQPIIKDVLVEPPARTPNSIERKQSPVSIFISRRDARLYVRQAMQPLFDLPLTLRDPHQPLGTHVYTAMEMKDGAMRWTAVSVPSAFAQDVRKTPKTESNGKKNPRLEAKVVSVAAPDASAALDRIDIPQEALDRLAGMVTPGSSLIVSDNPLSNETGKYTDFIVLTH
jgi:lipoprotein-anchoring transpeptidase ErfK/SrfK